MMLYFNILREQFQSDPLEQFSVVIALPFTGNITYFLLLIVLLTYSMTLILPSIIERYKTIVFNNYSIFILGLLTLVKTFVKENLNIKIQIFFLNIFYLFMFIFFANLLGLIPFSFTVTSSFVVTFFLAGMHFIGSFFIGAFFWQWHIINLVAPGGAPLIIMPFLIIIEFISYIARIFSLSIRLFANMLSGHALLKILTNFSHILLNSKNIVFIFLAIIPWLLVTSIFFLEILIAFLQAYIFSILATIYINDVVHVH